MIGPFSPFPVHCEQANSIVCGQILLGPQRDPPQRALHLLLIRGAAPQPCLSNLAACLDATALGWVWMEDSGCGVASGCRQNGGRGATFGFSILYLRR